MTRLVGIEIACACERLDHRIEALDYRDRIEVLGIGRDQRKRAAGRSGGRREHHACAALAQIIREIEQSALRRPARREHEQRIVLIDQRERTMA